MGEARIFMIDYFNNYFNVKLDPREFDKLVEERKKEYVKQMARKKQEK